MFFFFNFSSSTSHGDRHFHSAHLLHHHKTSYGPASKGHLDWLNWFHFLIFVADPFVILISCMIFLSPFLYAKRMSMSTVSSLSQLHFAILGQQNAFPWPMIHVTISLEVISFFCFWVLAKQLSYMLFIFTFFFFLVTPCFVVAFQPCMAWIPFF